MKRHILPEHPQENKIIKIWNKKDNDNNNIEQEELQKMKMEIKTLQDIEENKCTLRYHIKEEEESGQDLSMFDIAMDLFDLSVGLVLNLL